MGDRSGVLRGDIMNMPLWLLILLIIIQLLILAYLIFRDWKEREDPRVIIDKKSIKNRLKTYIYIYIFAILLQNHIIEWIVIAIHMLWGVSLYACIPYVYFLIKFLIFTLWMASPIIIIWLLWCIFLDIIIKWFPPDDGEEGK